MGIDISDYFSPQIFFIILRETLEAAIIISVLLAFLDRSFHTSSGYQELPTEPATSQESDNTAAEIVGGEKLYKRLRLQVWVGSFLGLLLCLFIGGIFIVVFNVAGSDLWAYTEHYWEGAFSILAAVIISVMGLAMLRLNQMKSKWHLKLNNLILNQTLQKENQTEKYAMFFLPFITTLREGMEAVVFIGGVGLDQPLSTIPASLLLGLAIGVSVGIALYKTGHTMSLRLFLIGSTGFLYLVAAGLFSKGVWQFELQKYIDRCGGQDMSEVGSGPGSYDIGNSVWHVNCCNGEMDGGWMLFTALFGWTNSATYGSVTSYIVFWVILVASLRMLRFEEKNGYLPFIPLSWQAKRCKKRILLLRSNHTLSQEPSNNQGSSE
ncbi:Putative high affinity iron transporter [Komagataella phaffii CBS 7435]|uniref:High affinity iron transporter involved in transport of intravacuolar stores of iron n=2 Tax=Komagataella phaffii TaxID=460519 RepID=C4R0M6_KOMPG|nr:Putative high affinity iron transporter involved in transport of intravacuolar stores of iron [Komagataella phaffii GS115]AOA62799.1 GQ67_00468T0 [Komagataella phaffii]CAH2448432.1 Putative high affinity iron transporter [Komagataella phaffii CBS 7435]AOA68059.1 GQ68_00921T0 [Komagataella phaffii GS115]CAY69050.1 Putative high affinity iron transporter involved in transport of intravacuolar stores of iron [Komagataella phaffii GS115]CCA38554.1 Putative high affinity iron transporter [Komaga